MPYADYIDWCAAHLARSDHEVAYILPIHPWSGMGAPVFLAEGLHHCTIEPMAVVRALHAAGVRRGVLAHAHLTERAPRPSAGDLRAVASLQQQLRTWHLALADSVIVNSQGRVLSFRHEGILANPVRDGLRLAEEGLAWAVQDYEKGVN
jgi:DNA repair protein RadC